MEKLEKFGGMSSLGRPGQPAELGSIYVQLASRDASYIRPARSTVRPAGPGSRNYHAGQDRNAIVARRYHAKRDFSRTDEPRGAAVRPGAGNLRYLIQKHEATRLHYDFRLELDGTQELGGHQGP
jgi:hypothetical protein